MESLKTPGLYNAYEDSYVLKTKTLPTSVKIDKRIDTTLDDAGKTFDKDAVDIDQIKRIFNN